MRIQEMIDNREVLRSEYQKIIEQYLIDGRTHIFDYDLGRFLTQEELINGVVFNYDLESQEEAN